MKKHLRKFQLRSEPMAFVPVVRGSNRLEVKASGDAHEIVLIGAIGKSWYDDSGITEQEFRDALKTVPEGKSIRVLINSEGGSVKEGLGIYNAIKDRRESVTAKITGYALSIASVFPLAASKVISPKSAIWMMHKAWSWNQGNADDMRQAAEMLDAHDETLASIYCEETGKSKEEILAAMEKETWIKGADAVDFGLADESDGDEDDSQAFYRPLAGNFLSRCKNISPEILNCIFPNAKISAAANGGQQQTKQNNNTMNKKLIVALLKTHGIEASETETDEQLQAKLQKIPVATSTTTPPESAKPAATATATAGVSREEFDAVKAQLKKAEEARVEARVLTYVEAGKITNDEAKIFVAAALADEKGTFEILDKKDASFSGTSPLGWSGISINEDNADPQAREGLTGLTGPRSEILVNIHKEHKTPQARHAAIKNVFDAAFKQACIKDRRAGKEVYAANTYSSTLVTNYLMDGAITDLVNVWAMLNAFSIAQGTDPFKPLAVGQLKHVTGSEAAQTNPTNFEPTDGSTVAPITITPAWINQPMRVGPTDLNNGLRIDDLRQKAIASFADAVTVAATTPITAANFTATPVISSAASFGLSDLATLQGQLQKSPIKNLILDGTYKARISNTPGFFQPAGTVGGGSDGWKPYGWDGIYLASNWSGAGNNIKGFACAPQALVRAMGLPLNPPNIPGGVFQTSTFEIPGCAAAAAMSMWFSLPSRTMFVSFDVIAGFGAADKTAGVVVASGTPS